MTFPEYSEEPRPKAVSLIDVLKGVLRRKFLVLGTTALAFGAGFGVVTLMKPVYTSTSQILIQDLETPFDRFQQTEVQRQADAVDDRIVASQISVIRSEDLGRRVVAALGLENNPEFNALIEGQGTVSQLKVRLGFDSDPALMTPEQRALRHYRSKLNVFQMPESNVVAIEYESPDPKTAAAIANTLADTYVMWTREAKSQPTERARDWLSQQIEGLRRKVQDSEAAVERFRSQAGLIRGQAVTLGEQEISELNTQITLSKAASLEARAKADSVRNLLESKGSVDTATDVLASPAIQRLKEQRADAMRRISELSVTYLDNHPRMVAARSDLDSIDRQIRSEALKIVASLDEQARIAETRERSLVNSLETLKGQESTANLDDVKLKALERDAAADRALLEAMLIRFAEASARQDTATQPGLGVIIQTASVSSVPSFPKPGPTVLLLTVAGFAVGLGLAFLIELMAAANRLTAENTVQVRPRVEPPLAAPVTVVPAAPVTVVPAATAPVFDAPTSPEPAPQPQPVSTSPPVEDAQDIVDEPAPPPAWSPPPVLAPAQHLTVWPRIPSHASPATACDMPEVLQSARVMTRWVMEARRTLDVRRVGLASVGGGPADAAVAALSISRSLAFMGKRTLLLDMVQSASPVSGLCGLPEGLGLSDLVTGSADFTKIIGRDNRSPVHVLRYGQNSSSEAQDLVLERLDSVMGALASAYEFAIVNLGEAVNETPIYLHKCDAALLLAPASQLDEAASAVQTLLETGLVAAQHVLIGAPASAVPAASVQPEPVTA